MVAGSSTSESTAPSGSTPADDVEAEVTGWIDDHWDPALPLGEWWQAMADAGLSHALLPVHAGGRGWSQSMVGRAMKVMADRDVVGPPPGLGTMLAAPTIADHGSREQIERLIPPILNGRHAWCQLFSEPVAGSDLAGLQTRAEADGDEWRVSGQKVWTSQGHYADYGLLVARTDPDLPKHKGMSYFVIEMDQPGIDIRPLKEMTGRTFFSEVFLDGAVVSMADMIGARGEGWRVANTTLTYERTSIGAGSSGVTIAAPGSKADNFDRPVGDIIAAAARRRAGGHAPGPGLRLYHRWVELARRLGRTDDPLLRQEIMELYTLLSVNRMNLQRARVRAQRTGGEPNIAKLFDAEIHRRFRDVILRIVQADGMLSGQSSATDPVIASFVLHAQAPAIYGGTDQIQRNILSERVLGLPREPGPDRATPFSELPRNV